MELFAQHRNIELVYLIQSPFYIDDSGILVVENFGVIDGGGSFSDRDNFEWQNHQGGFTIGPEGYIVRDQDWNEVDIQDFAEKR
jgi:hypothetical protein